MFDWQLSWYETGTGTCGSDEHVVLDVEMMVVAGHTAYGYKE